MAFLEFGGSNLRLPDGCFAPLWRRLQACCANNKSVAFLHLSPVLLFIYMLNELLRLFRLPLLHRPICDEACALCLLSGCCVPSIIYPVAGEKRYPNKQSKAHCWLRILLMFYTSNTSLCLSVSPVWGKPSTSWQRDGPFDRARRHLKETVAYRDHKAALRKWNIAFGQSLLFWPYCSLLSR